MLAAGFLIQLASRSGSLRQVDPSMIHSPRSVTEFFSIQFRLFWRVVKINGVRWS
jgi:hypothetical protein